MTTDELQKALQDSFNEARVAVNDMTGTSDHFQVLLVSKSFEGKSLVDRHRLVYSALGSVVGQEVHALSLDTLTPEEAQKKNL